MTNPIEVKVPDIGDFADVPVIEILVKAGDSIKAEDPLVMLESDKATMEVPAPLAGTVVELKVSVGDTVSEVAVGWMPWSTTMLLGAVNPSVTVATTACVPVSISETL